MKGIWMWLGVLVLTLGLLAGAAFAFFSMGRSEPLSTLQVSELPLIGEAQAPHEILLITDYACPACRRYHQAVLPEVMKRYVDTGQAHLRVAVFPVRPGSTELSRAVHCAGREAGMTWSELHRRVYAEDFAQLAPAAMAARLLALPPSDARVRTLVKCMGRQDVVDAVDRQRYQVLARGITTVPSVAIDRRLVEDPWTPDRYASLLQATAAR